MVTEEVVLLVMVSPRVEEVPTITVPKLRSAVPSWTVPGASPLRAWQPVKSKSPPTSSRAVAKRRHNR